MADPPNLTLIPEADPWEREKAQAERELAWESREFAANLLRVMRGAGRPFDLPQQIINLSESILEVSKTARAWAVSSAIEETLQSAVPGGFDAHEHEECTGMIVSGALQLLASRLVHQRAQEAAGEREMASGIKEQERYFEREREKFRKEQEAWIAARRKPTKSKPRVKKSKPVVAAPQAVQSPLPTVDSKPRSTAEFMKARRRELRDRAQSKD